MPHRPAHFPVIDGFEFAKTGAALRGVWPVSDLPRLRDALHSDAGALEYDLRGARDERGRPMLRLAVSGVLRLACQRCLGRLDFAVSVDARLVLAATQAEIHEEQIEPNEPDKVLASKEMAVRDLLEEELLLAMPYAPRHDRCEARSGAGLATQQSPFAGLRGLLGEGGSSAGKKRP